MLIDGQNRFSLEQAITTTANSTNIVKMSVTDLLPEVAFGCPLPLLIQVVESFAGATSVKVAVQTSATEEFSSPTTLAETAAVPGADLKAGYRFPIVFVPKGNKGYLKLVYTVNGTATAGKITAGIIAGHDNSYQDA